MTSRDLAELIAMRLEGKRGLYARCCACGEWMQHAYLCDGEDGRKCFEQWRNANARNVSLEKAFPVAPKLVTV